MQTLYGGDDIGVKLFPFSAFDRCCVGLGCRWKEGNIGNYSQKRKTSPDGPAGKPISLGCYLLQSQSGHLHSGVPHLSHLEG
jgi:hypothetical protein